MNAERRPRWRVGVWVAVAAALAVVASRVQWAQAPNCAPGVRAQATGPFTDVPLSHPMYTAIQQATTAGLMTGCGASYFCPGEFVPREDAAVFLEKGMRGVAFAPAQPATARYSDVAITYCLAGWIEQLAGDGITSTQGCPAGSFCPFPPLTRAQISELLGKARYWKDGLGGQQPPAAVGMFTDVGPADFAANWIEELYNQSITGGCFGVAPAGAFVPSAPITRAEMACLVNAAFSGTPMYWISGTVTSGGVGLQGVTVTAGTRRVTTDTVGQYTITGLPAGTYVVTPAKPSYSFAPANLTVAVGPSVSGQSFVATFIPATYSISGNVGTGGATVSAGAVFATADGSGNYTFSGLAAGTYTVTPSKPGCTFSPTSLAVIVGPSATGQNFAASCPPATYSISGNVGTSGATVTMGSVSVFSDPSGAYAVTGLVAGTYTITPSKGGCTFAPASLTVTVGPSAAGQNFVASCGASSFTISGRVSSVGIGIPGVLVQHIIGLFSATTDANGAFALTGVPPNSTIDIVAVASGCSFSPSTIRVMVGTADVAGINFSASCTPDKAPFLTATAWNARNKIEWLNPVDPTYVGTVVMRKLGGFPTGPTDPAATLVVNDTGVFSGAHRTATALTLTNGATANSMVALNPSTGATVWQFTNAVAQGGDGLAIGIIAS